MGVSFVSIMRPMPIGWDDLGVYMNWPKIMALNEEVLHWAGFFAWQIITGTGFLFDMSAPQAFFINQVGGILFIIAIILSASLLFGEKQTIQNEKWEKMEKEVNHIISLPILLAGIMYAMPMIIFQQAKDMKLDPALLFFSITGITALWYGWKHKTIEHKRFFPYFAHKHQELDEPLNNRENHKFLIIVWVLIGFAFTVKITTLMVILAGFAYIFYRYLGLLGLFSFTGFFISAFTGLRLWDMLNVVYPKNDVTFVQTTTTIALIIGAFLLGLSTWRHGFTRLKNTIISILLVTLGIVIATSPWLIKNISESGSLKTQSILWGSGGYKTYDHGVIYSKEELKKIEDGSADLLSASGQSSNEDLGRYFWYEKWVNNYLKLPTNLTFQKNQPGEFTDITYIYLALIPVLFIFLVSRNHIFSIVTLAVLFSAYTYYFGFNDPTGTINALFGFSGDTLTTSQAITRYLESWNLPEWYLIILGIFIFWVTAFDLLLTPTERNRKIRGVVIFTAFYSFIFVISAFGIVWYGIAVYFCFLVLIGFSALSFTTYTDDEEKNEWLMTVKILLSLALFIVVNTYFIRSTFPHGWNNLRQSSFTTFKAGKIDQETAIFESHPDYLETIAALNLKDPKTTMVGLLEWINNPILTAILKNELSAINILRYSQWIQYGWQDQISALIANGLKAGLLTDEAIKKWLPTLKSDTEKLRKKFYNTVLYPSKDIANNSGIYRIGTFMTYFIYNNMWRYYDDSLVINFDKYFYDPTPETTVERMKRMDVNFFLTDLNAATIDKDPRHNLTKRFEELLLTFRAKNLELIDTDSLCLRLAVDEWHRGNLTEDAYLALAGVNYESYPASGGVIYRGQKQINCYNYMIGLMQANKVTQTDYPYLFPIMQAIGTKEKPSQDEIVQIFQQYVTHGWFAFFRMK